MESGTHFGLIREYYEELERDPESPIFVALADAYRESGLVDEALAVCQRGLRVHPNYAAAHLVLGQIYMDKGMVEPAEQEINLALQLDSNNAIALAALGYLHAVTGRAESAVKYLDQANFLSPDDAHIAKYLEEARNAAKQGAGSEGAGRFPNGSEGPDIAAGVSERFLREISEMEGVDASLLIDQGGRHQATAGAGHLMDDAFGRSLVVLRSGSAEYATDVLGPFERLLIEGTEGSIFAARMGEDLVAAIISASAQPGPVALSIECFVAGEG